MAGEGPGRHNARVKLVNIELAFPIVDLSGLGGYASIRGLVHIHGTPIGFVDLDVVGGGCRSADISAQILRQLSHELQPHLGNDVSALAIAGSGDLGLRAMLDPHREIHDVLWPSMTIAVCTRSRPADLDACLTSLMAIDYPELEIIVVDNAPVDDAGAEVCATYPAVRYLVEVRPGLNWARNRAVLHASGEILAFTDDDVRVDPGWAKALAVPFLEDTNVMAVAGLVIPLELETRAQLVFEEYGGLSGGFRPMKMQGMSAWGVRGMWHYALMAQHGSGANMALRRSVFDRVGLFDPALDVGTATNGGGDTEMLFRVMAEGFTMVYEPRAVVRHRHRRDFDGLTRQISGWGSGTYAWLTRTVLRYPRAWWVMVLLGARGLVLKTVQLVRPSGLPRRLVLAELRGALVGPFRCFRARKRARELESLWGPQQGARHEL